MAHEPAPQRKDVVALYSVYTVELRDHAVALVWLGYQRMDAPSFVSSEEDDITGELLRHMRDVLDGGSPTWVEHYSVSEQSRVSGSAKLGKRRPIVDVEVERHCQGPRPRLRFEAKRLGPRHSVRKYLGKEGLRRFLDRTYPAPHGEAGMLGYAQADTEAEWAARVTAELERSRDDHRVQVNGIGKPVHAGSQMPTRFESRHTDAINEPLRVTHVLLRFV